MLRLTLPLMAGLSLLCAGCGSNQYVLRNGGWQYEHQHGWDGTDVIPLEGADVASFRTIDEVYGRDAHSVYFKGRRLAGADPRTFKRIRVTRHTWYSADAHAVFCDETRLPDSDPASFRFMDDFTLDRNHVYKGCQVLPLADAATFHREGAFWVDRSHVFTSIQLIPDLNPATLVQHPGGIWFQDDQRICSNSRCLRPDDIASFRVMRGAYARDKSSFYSGSYAPKRMAVADPASFVAIDDNWARDSSKVYWQGDPVAGANPATFKILSSHKGLDGTTCYWAGRKSDPSHCL